MRHTGQGSSLRSETGKGTTAVRKRRKETKEKEKEMYADFYAAQDRALRRQEFAEKVAERQRHARPEDKPSLRARLARQLFTLAVVTEREETWRVVWERLEARRP